MFFAFQRICQPELNVNYKQNIGYLFNINCGIWWRRLFDSADLPKPGIVGWSGILFKKMSSFALNMSTLWLSMFLKSAGSKLKILAPLTPREDSLAFLTGAGEDDTTSCGRAVLPRRPALLVHCTWYPLTMPWEIFQRKSIMYLFSFVLVKTFSFFWVSPRKSNPSREDTLVMKCLCTDSSLLTDSWSPGDQNWPVFSI